jgi:hypothetical protein
MRPWTWTASTPASKIRGERAPPVVRAEVADAGLAGPAIDEGVDGLGAQSADGDSAGLVDRAEQRAVLVEASDVEPGGHGAAAAGGKGRAALTAALAGYGEVDGGGVVVLDVKCDRLGSAQAAHEEGRQHGGVSAAAGGLVGQAAATRRQTSPSST